MRTVFARKKRNINVSEKRARKITPCLKEEVTGGC